MRICVCLEMVHVQARNHSIQAVMNGEAGIVWSRLWSQNVMEWMEYGCALSKEDLERGWNSWRASLVVQWGKRSRRGRVINRVARCIDTC